MGKWGGNSIGLTCYDIEFHGGKTKVMNFSEPIIYYIYIVISNPFLHSILIFRGSVRNRNLLQFPWLVIMTHFELAKELNRFKKILPSTPVISLTRITSSSFLISPLATTGTLTESLIWMKKFENLRCKSLESFMMPSYVAAMRNTSKMYYYLSVSIFIENNIVATTETMANIT